MKKISFVESIQLNFKRISVGEKDNLMDKVVNALKGLLRIEKGERNKITDPVSLPYFYHYFLLFEAVILLKSCIRPIFNLFENFLNQKTVLWQNNPLIVLLTDL